MRFRAFSFLAALAIGCSGGGGEPAPSSASNPIDPARLANEKATSGASCPAVVADACKPAFHVSTGAEVIAASKAFDYQRVSISRAGKLEVGDDLVADQDIEVKASDLGAGPDCGPDRVGPVCHAPLFRARGFPSYAAVPGITCAEESADQPVRSRFACERVAIAKGTTFRLRAVIEDMHPSAPNYWAFIDFVAPCTTTCGAGEVLCAATHTCFEAGYGSCAFCEGESPAVCACRADACNLEPAGTECSFASSPDVQESGTCAATGCVARR